jgi:hypothetical protein
MTVQTGRIRKAHELHASGNDLFLKAGGLTTPFTTQNRPKAACDSIGLHDAIREIASIIRDYCDSEGSGEDVRRTSYTLPPKGPVFALIFVRHGYDGCKTFAVGLLLWQWRRR